MRGAYEVGVVLGIAEVLGRKATDPAMFQVLAGTSVGAINAAFYAANSHYGDHAASALRDVWTALNLKDHAHLRPFGLLRPPRALRRFRDWFVDGRGSSLLDTSALEEVVRRSVDWQKLHSNVENGLIDALLIAALHVVSGRTTVFAELSREADYAPSRDQRRAVRFVQIEADHVLASAAIPLLFPTRRVGDQYYSDGGLRFNTPIAPAIRAGAERIVVISVMRERSTSEADLVESMAPPGRGRDLSPIFLVGKLLNALLLDPVLYDLQVLERFNQLMSVLEQALPPEQMQRVQNVLAGNRGIGYRKLRTLIFTPSQDLGKLAGRYLRTQLKLTDLNPFVKYALQRAGSDDPAQEADWASYLLFDGGFAAELIEVGRNDAHAKSAEIKSFFQD